MRFKQCALLLAVFLSSFLFFSSSAYSQAETHEPNVEQTLKEASQQVLVSLIQQATKAGDFIAEQVPLVVQELLAWKFAFNLALGGIFLVMTCIAVWLGVKCHEKSYGEGWLLATPVSLVTGIPAIILLGNALQIIVAPRVWLLEYAAAFVK